MARLARADLVDPAEVAAFHCIHRCVRRSFLCGDDPYTGQNYNHRKVWLEERLEFLAGLFGVDVIGMAIMSNHFHLVVRSRPDVVAQWDDTEVARRWTMLCPLRRDDRGAPEAPTAAELDLIRNQPDRLTEIRRRLSDISWVMRMLAEPVARRANREDAVTGRFWEGRYKCVKLCDEAALLACLAYVDLNPVRAGLARGPEDSDHTSAQRRIEATATQARHPTPVRWPQPESLPDAWLAPLELNASHLGPQPSEGGRRASDKGCLPMSVAEYLELLDWTGRQLARDKRGTIPADLAPILQRTGIAPSLWLEVVGRFGRYFHRVAGASQAVGNERPRRNRSASFHPGRSDLLDAA